MKVFILLLIGIIFIVLNLMKLYIYKRFIRHSLLVRKWAFTKWIFIALLLLLAIGEISMFAVRDVHFSPSGFLLIGSCVIFTYCLFMACLCVDCVRILVRNGAPKSCCNQTQKVCLDSINPSQNALSASPKLQSASNTSPLTPRRKFLQGMIDTSIALLFVCFSVQGFKNALTIPPVKEVRIKLAGLKKPKRIAMITDVHIGKTLGYAFLADVVAKINALKPDVVVIVGDLIDDKIENIKADLEPLKSLQSTEGVYYVAGNHEYYHGVEPILAHLQTLNLNILHNKHIELADLNLAGVSDLSAARFGYEEPNLAAAKAGLNTQKPNVLLVHQPKFVRQNDVSDFDLVLCGHTHAGQVFPLSFFVWLEQHYVHGLYKLPQHTQSTHTSQNIESKPRQTQLYVSSGVGFWGPAIRFLAPSEIVLLKLEGE